MAVVKTARKFGAKFGSVLDEEDRTLLSQALVLIGGGAILILTAAGVFGLAVRLFEVAAG